jgi:hypothetical protein
MAEQENHYGFDEGGDDDQSIVSVCVVLIILRAGAAFSLSTPRPLSNLGRI